MLTLYHFIHKVNDYHQMMEIQECFGLSRKKDKVLYSLIQALEKRSLP